MSDKVYVLRSGGYFVSENTNNQTTRISEADRFTLKAAEKAAEGVTCSYHHIDEFKTMQALESSWVPTHMNLSGWPFRIITIAFDGGRPVIVCENKKGTAHVIPESDFIDQFCPLVGRNDYARRIVESIKKTEGEASPSFTEYNTNWRPLSQIGRYTSTPIVVRKLLPHAKYFYMLLESKTFDKEWISQSFDEFVTISSGSQATPANKPWAPTHRHRKGGLYRVIARGLLEANHTPVVTYDDREGNVWVRPAAEFDDGRFKPLPAKEGE